MKKHMKKNILITAIAALVFYSVSAEKISAQTVAISANESGKVAIGATAAQNQNEILSVVGNMKVGSSGSATGTSSVAFGNSTTASGVNSASFGVGTIASNEQAMAFGNYTKATGRQSAAFGYYTTASNDSSTAFGGATIASAANATAFGDNTTASGIHSVAFGNYTVASGVGSAVFGHRTTSSGQYSSAFGNHTTASGKYSAAFGNGTTASGQDSVAFGNNTTSSSFHTAAFGVGTTASNYQATAFGWGTLADNQSSVAIGNFNQSLNGTSHVFVVGNGSAANSRVTSFSINYDGTTVSNSSMTATGFITASDKRFKENVKPLKNSLEKINKLQGVSYEWNQKKFPKMAFEKGNQIGFIAQDVEKVFPEIVSKNEEGYKGVSYDRLTPVLVEAVKELTAKNKELENRNNNLQKDLKEIQKVVCENNLKADFCKK